MDSKSKIMSQSNKICSTYSIFIKIISFGLVSFSILFWEGVYCTDCNNGLISIALGSVLLAVITLQNFTISKENLNILHFVPALCLIIMMFNGRSSPILLFTLIAASITLFVNIFSKKLAPSKSTLFLILGIFVIYLGNLIFPLSYFYLAGMLIMALYPFGMFAYSKIKIKNNVSK